MDNVLSQRLDLIQSCVENAKYIADFFFLYV